FKRVFSSIAVEVCENGVPVMNADIDCISYSPFLLEFRNIDVNHDGVNDISFVGKVNYYCEGLEANIGRKDRQPLRSQNITITFLTSSQDNIFSWRLKDSSICKQIMP